ncbi:MAG TPA: hypothetical protein VD902_17450 [Symbiobacteriaceae bacterium]|nr:hypothetical protein [Symbiobacteriaceae bacterium]
MSTNIVIAILISMTTIGAVTLALSGNAVQAGALIALATALIPHLGGGRAKKNGKKDHMQ